MLPEVWINVLNISIVPKLVTYILTFGKDYFELHLLLEKIVLLKSFFIYFFSLSDVPVSSSEKMYSGLYEYHIPSNTWTKRRDDVGQVPTSGSGQATSGFRHELKSRYMLFFS